MIVFAYPTVVSIISIAVLIGVLCLISAYISKTCPNLKDETGEPYKERPPQKGDWIIAWIVGFIVFIIIILISAIILSQLADEMAYPSALNITTAIAGALS